eukprot:GAHX01000545.1.p1 GENE.GAHX01000545.1~~GAHX01000545.1.p1  ORF type:complete len:628 (+),score=143.79 GAHX01000545.1:48-1886(+)
MNSSSVLILYGSETSICQYYASTLHRQLLINNIHSHICEGNKATPEVLAATNILLIVTSNTKEGQPPSNIEQFYYGLLKKSNNKDMLAHLQFTIFGVGNSTYEKHNRVGKVLSQRLSQLGARPLTGPFFFDKKMYEDCCYGFIDRVKDTTKEILKQTNKDTLYKDDDFSQTFIEPVLSSNSPNEKSASFDHSEGETIFEIVENETTTAKDHFQTVNVIKMKGKGNKLGDTVGLRVPNLPEEIDALIKRLGFAHDTTVTFPLHCEKNPKSETCCLCKVDKFYETTNYIFYNYYNFGSSKVRIHDFIKNFIEIRQTVAFISLKYLVHLTDNETEKNKLVELGTREGIKRFYNYVFSEKRHIVEVLRDFPNVQINLPVLLEFMPPLKIRQFSITNSTLDYNDKDVYENKLEILVAIIQYNTPYKVERKGLFSDYIHFNQNADKRKFYGKIMNTFLSTQEIALVNKPCLFIATGTGVSAVICYLKYKYEKCLLSGKDATMNDLLVFGFRFIEKDYHYKEDIAKFKERGLTVLEAVSRDNKKYVQDMLTENKEMMWDYIDKRNAIIVLCGKAGLMPRCVRKALREIFMGEGRMDEDEMKKYYSELEKKNRILEETWA